MRFRAAPPIVLALLALCVAGPARAGAPHGRLDRGFGRSGVATAAVPKTWRGVAGFEVGGGGRAYVLDGSSLLAFRSDGKLARGFGDDGRVEVRSAAGRGEPAALAIDSRGRLLVAGSIRGPAARFWTTYTAYVLRILSDGRRDPGFGNSGEVDTDFGLPVRAGSELTSVAPTSIVVDAEDRPVIGGSSGESIEPCEVEEGGGGPAPFAARLSPSGGIDETFGEAGHALLDRIGSVESLALVPGGLAVFSRPCAGLPRVETRAPVFNYLSEGGRPGSPAVQGGLYFSWGAPTVDPDGRILELEEPPPTAEEGHEALVRLLPDDARPDPSFGDNGRIVFRGREEPGAFAVDPEDRPVIASAAGLRRFFDDGTPDKGFGPGGRLKEKGAPSAIAFDSRGRIYTVGLRRTRTRATVQVARYIPGR